MRFTDRYEKPISYSQMAEYDTCPFKFADRHRMGNKPPERSASNRGQELHDKLEEFFTGRSPFPSQDRVLRPWQRLMEGLSLKNPSAEGEVAARKDWSSCGWWDKDCDKRGKHDLRIYEGDSVDIFDWKSGQIYPDHEKQGENYCALEPGAYRIYRTHFAYLDAPLVVHTREYAHDQVLGMRNKIDAKIEVMRSDLLCAPTPSSKCYYCHLSYKKGGPCGAAR